MMTSVFATGRVNAHQTSFPLLLVGPVSDLVWCLRPARKRRCPMDAGGTGGVQGRTLVFSIELTSHLFFNNRAIAFCASVLGRCRTASVDVAAAAAAEMTVSSTATTKTLTTKQDIKDGGEDEDTD